MEVMSALWNLARTAEMKLLYRGADDNSPSRNLLLIDKAVSLKLRKLHENIDVQVH
jgi:hypothetical protein